MPYFDTSAVVPLLTPEPGSQRMEQWVGEQGRLMLSSWTCTETASALGIKARTGALSADRARAALKLFRTTLLPSFFVAPVDDGDMQRAAGILERFELGLRAGDALHLAIAQRLREPLVTFDRRLAAAADAVGVEVVVPS